MSSLVDTFEHAGLVLSGAVLCLLFVQWRKRQTGQVEASESQSQLQQARREAEIILRDARLTASEDALKQHELAEQAVAARRAERLELEKRLAERESLINSQLQRVVEAEKTLAEEKQSLGRQRESLKAREETLSGLESQWSEQLQKAASLSPAEARDALLKRVEQEALRDANTLTRHILDDARSKRGKEARRILTLAIQRYAGEHTFESTTASIALPTGDDIKGRIIGREGRNIRAFEAATGV